MIVRRSANDEGMVELPSGSTYMRVAGSGPVLLVVHGGPGMEHTYLLDGLSPLHSMYTVCHYDQIAVGHDGRPESESTLANLETQLREVVGYVRDHYSNSVSIIAHSWGSHLALTTAPWRTADIERLYLVNPMALTWDRFLEANKKFVGKIPADELHEIMEVDKLGTKQSGIKELGMLMPYYVGSDSPRTGLEFADYNTRINAAVIGSLEGYDLRQSLDDLPSETTIIFGSEDFSQPDDLRELATRATFVVVDGAGHFPFFERNNEFCEILV